MIVEDKIHVTGRGWVILSEADEPPTLKDMVLAGDKYFGIVGVERVSYSKNLGLVLVPNNEVNEVISVGDTIEIIKQK